MADETGLDDRLAELAAEGRRFAVPPAAEQIRARGDRRRRRKRAAQVSGGALLAVAVAVGGLWLVVPGPEAAPAATKPTSSRSASPFVPPAPAPGEEYASEIGYVYDATVLKDAVQVTVEQVRAERGTAVPTGVVHTLTLSSELPVEVEQVAGGKAGDMRLGELVDRLSGEPRWLFALDYDGEGRVQSLREASWLTVE
ncbi:putative membrane protein [Streptomyces davaonensis JCM 4913]|uniref:Putative membrane protein n=1 Tax=Streptomyces davaonensis (strain DSM 101723 / JCM 4913 / KCC S-0913 / 768) TaxID=1214101 RepID=K4QUX9_STRDJ|nr:hypothetical protein [Streptomyces davaonensis]CCK27811.1 putative membrane protein [Streptomyces davaonensis JCM 4913]